MFGWLRALPGQNSVERANCLVDPSPRAPLQPYYRAKRKPRPICGGAGSERMPKQ